MSILSLPLRSDVPDFAYTLELEGATYGFRFRWNGRAGLWHVDILDATATPILVGLPLTVGFGVLSTYRSRVALPPGELELVDMEGEARQATREGLGSRFHVLYHESTDMALLYAGGA